MSAIGSFKDIFVHILTEVDAPRTTTLVSKQWLEWTRESLSRRIPQFNAQPFLKIIVDQISAEITSAPALKIGDIDYYTLDSAKVIAVYKRVLKEAGQYPNAQKAITDTAQRYEKRSPERLEIIAKQTSEDKKHEKALNSIYFLQKLYDLAKFDARLSPIKDILDASIPVTFFNDVDQLSTEEIQQKIDAVNAIMSQNQQRLLPIEQLFLPFATPKAPLKYLPEEINVLPGLKSLTICSADFPLRSLPYSQLSALTALTFDAVNFDDSFERLITDLSQLPNLEQLVFRGCRLANVPENIVHLLKLKKLGFENCQLANFPWHALQLPALEELNLWNNSIAPDEERLGAELVRIGHARNFLCSFTNAQFLFVIKRLKDELFTRTLLDSCISLRNSSPQDTLLSTIFKRAVATAVIAGTIIFGLAEMLFLKILLGSIAYGISLGDPAQSRAKIFAFGIGSVPVCLAETCVAISLLFQNIYEEDIVLEELEEQVTDVPWVGPTLKSVYRAH